MFSLFTNSLVLELLTPLISKGVCYDPISGGKTLNLPPHWILAHTKRVTLGYFEAQSRLSLRLITSFHPLTEVVKTKL